MMMMMTCAHRIRQCHLQADCGRLSIAGDGGPPPWLHDFHMTMILINIILLLAGIWESKVREEKDEDADDKDENKEAAQNQLHFPFHLWMAKLIVSTVSGKI